MQTRILPTGRTDDGRTKPGSPQTPFFERKIANFLSPIFFFKKKFGAKFFLAILKMKRAAGGLGGSGSRTIDRRATDTRRSPCALTGQLSPSSFERPEGQWGPRPRAPAPVPVARRLSIWLSCPQGEYILNWLDLLSKRVEELRQKSKSETFLSSQVKVYSSRRQKSHMQRQWARLARRGWCAGVVPTAPRSLERIRREMRQAEPPARGGAAQASLGL